MGHRASTAHHFANPDFSASLMCANLGSLSEEVRALECAGVTSHHVDIMDGHFVPNLTLGPDSIAAIAAAASVPVHAHMMVEHPELYVHQCAAAGVDVYIFHIEATRYPVRLTAFIASAGMVPAVAINPATPLAIVKELDAAFVLIMTVEPGFAGQLWLPQSQQRVKEAGRLVRPDVAIGVDGNVSPERAAEAYEAGATLFVCGTSSLFTGEADYGSAVRSLHQAIFADRVAGPPLRASSKV
jgi:ribulose-phosphate 3-epimerase